jgi:crotonobetainyl-CoA:carnitine CoA-transferase CaiB-like acyl-CoA transferase
MACANDRLYRRLVVDVLDRPDLVTDPQFAHRKNRTANKEKLRAIIAGIFASDSLEHWMAKMKKANIPVGHLRPWKKVSTRRKCAVAIASARFRIRPRAPSQY